MKNSYSAPQIIAIKAPTDAVVLTSATDLELDMSE